jgi:hypothetical protein
LENLIDLDNQESFETLLEEYENAIQPYTAMAATLCRGKITYVEFQKLTRYLGIYKYILPAERTILPPLSDYLYATNRYNLFGLALLVSHISANLNLEDQHLLLKRLSAHGQRMEKLPENRDILVPTPLGF